MLTAPAWPQPVSTMRPRVAHVDDERLVVEDERVGFPPVVVEPFVEWEAGLEVGGSVDFAGDEHRSAEHERSLATLDDLEALLLERLSRQRREFHRRHLRDRDPAATPHQRMHNDRESGTSPQPGETLEPAGMVEVPVAQHRHFNVAGIDVEALHVVGHAVR